MKKVGKPIPLAALLMRIGLTEPLTNHHFGIILLNETEAGVIEFNLRGILWINSSLELSEIVFSQSPVAIQIVRFSEVCPQMWILRKRELYQRRYFRHCTGVWKDFNNDPH